ncbi:hypothetical protein ACF0H5_009697 [Mactra antiquata]
MASQKLKGGYGLKSKKFKIFVETYYDAGVEVGWFETTRENVDTRWSDNRITHQSTVQFPVPIRNKGNEVVMQTCLENLLKDVQKRGFKSLRFCAFGSWIMKIFVPILWNAACSTDVDLYIVLSPLDSEITETKAILQSLESKGNKDGSKANVASSNGSSNVMYPYCTYMKPPRSYREEFTCCLGPKQNVFVYTGNVLDIPKVDMMVCGDKVNSNTSGMLATLLLDKCGPKYKSNKAEAFKGKSEGDVVVCATEKYRYVAHMCLIPEKNIDPVVRPLRVNDMFKTVFEEMKVRECRTVALPLIGTGKAHGDPEFYAERFIDSLLQFSFNNKSFEFNIHLVNLEQAKTDTTIKIICTMVDEVPKYAPILPCKPTDYNRIIESPVKRPISAHDQGNQRHHTSNHKYKDGGTTRNHSNKSKSSSEDKRKSKYHESNLDMSDHSSSTKKASRTRKPNAGKRKEERKSSTDTNNHNSYPRNDDNFSDDDENPVRNDDVSKNSKLMQDTSKKKETSRGSPTELVSSMKLSVKAKTNEMPGNLRIFCGEADGQNDTVAETDSHRMNVSEAENENSALDSDGEDDYDIGDGDDDDYDDDTGDGGDKDNCDHYHASRTHDSNDDDSDQDDDYMTKHPEPEETLEDCVICMDTIEVNDIKELACGHKFHADCIDQQFVYKEACPTCGHVCGIITESSMYPWEHQPTFLCEEFDPPEKPTYEKRGANFDGSMLLNRTEKSMTAPPFKIKDKMAARPKRIVKKMPVLPKTGMEMRSTSTIEDVSGVFKLENIRGNLFLITFGSLKPVKFTATSTDVTNKGNILCDGENIYQLIIVNEAIKLIPISEVETFSTAPKSELTDKSLIKPGTTNEEKSKYDELASGSDFVDEG